ncbi:hypothetical protein GQ43DRAFT_373095 [Delitschia confertaspora ATCC 74209]|uniref:Zn(2)-C6 fungal-type domain-containing protein n=1 Tax=Delitschia confertaspora ATCC 74209 TaxID=1513339 RepID=A0A9P4JPL0_9PLEO|nr:hypothetical protein GQ43DRAFT_373095 [Delitschia confertaspora ATCC 74209]
MWNDEIYDSFFQDASFTGGLDYHQPESIVSDALSAPPSAPPSVVGGSFSDYTLAWQGPSPSPLTTLNTSSLTGLGDTFHAKSYNPFISPTSPQNISPQACDNISGWSDQPITSEPVPSDTHTRAINIPQPSYESYRYPQTSSSWLAIPPLLSASPNSTSSFSGLKGPRNRSKSDPRTASSPLPSSLSPRSNSFGWVQYQLNQTTSKLVPSGTTGGSKRPRGRKTGLSPEQRRNAALMRVIKACSNCRKRKEKCDPGIPCKACLDHYKGDLVHSPCRDRLMADLSKIFLSERLGWHPTSRSLSLFLGDNNYMILENTTHTIPLSFGFGPCLYLPVHPLQIHHDRSGLIHQHVIYPWPPSASPTGKGQYHAVLPAVLTADAVNSLQSTLDSHLSLLVREHFRAFPLYNSQLSLLKAIYILYRFQPSTTPSARLLLQSLKLLALVHIGGDLTLPAPSSGPMLMRLVRTSMLNSPVFDCETTIPTPCFIRAQFGAVMPRLAIELMQDTLSGLERLCLERKCDDWSVGLATLVAVLMAVESVQYHAAKVPYHAAYSQETERETAGARMLDEQGVDALVSFYRACFGGCHSRLRDGLPSSSSCSCSSSSFCTSTSSSFSSSSPIVSPEDKFIDSVRETMGKARRSGYLGEKSRIEVQGDGKERDMGWFFDRLVARLLVEGMDERSTLSC